MADAKKGIVNKVIEGQEVVLDGASYTDCVFRQCQIVFRASGGDVTFNGNDVLESEIVLEGAAADTVQFLIAFSKMPGNEKMLERLGLFLPPHPSDAAPAAPEKL